MKKHFVLLALMVFFALGDAYSQIELQPGIMLPQGDYYPYLLNTGIGAELKFNVIGDMDDQFKAGGVVSYYTFTPTQDTFATYGVGGNPVQLLPGYEVIHSYSIFGIGLYCNYEILDKPFTPIIGADFYFQIYSISHDEYTETLVQSSTTGDTYLNFALDPRVGVQYKLNDHWVFSGGIGYSLGFGGTYGSQNFVKTYIGVTYNWRDE